MAEAPKEPSSPRSFGKDFRGAPNDASASASALQTAGAALVCLFGRLGECFEGEEKKQRPVLKGFEGEKSGRFAVLKFFFVSWPLESHHGHLTIVTSLLPEKPSLGGKLGLRKRGT